MNVISEILRGTWMLDPLYARQYYPLVQRVLLGDIPIDPSLDNITSELHPGQSGIVSKVSSQYSTAIAYDVLQSPEQITDPSVFTLDIVGPITKHNQFCGPRGMQTKATWLKAADKHQNIFAHILKIDSPGGEAYACRYFAEVLQSLDKPVFAFVDGMAASAAYWIAASCDHIAVSSEMDRVGSIGTYVTIADLREHYKKEGINLVEVYASKSTDKNKDYLSAIDGDTTRLQKIVDQFNEYFINAVSRYRSNQLSEDQNTWGTGKMFFAKEAIKIGLIDDVSTLDNYISEIFQQYSPKQ